MTAHAQDREIARLRCRVEQLMQEVADLERDNLALQREIDFEQEHSRSVSRVVAGLEARMQEFVLGDAA
jgi:hypothetical protein